MNATRAGIEVGALGQHDAHHLNLVRVVTRIHAREPQEAVREE